MHCGFLGTNYVEAWELVLWIQVSEEIHNRHLVEREKVAFGKLPGCIALVLQDVVESV